MEVKERENILESIIIKYWVDQFRTKNYLMFKGKEDDILTDIIVKNEVLQRTNKPIIEIPPNEVANYE